MTLDEFYHQQDLLEEEVSSLTYYELWNRYCTAFNVDTDYKPALETFLDGLDSGDSRYNIRLSELPTPDHFDSVDSCSEGVDGCFLFDEDGYIKLLSDSQRDSYLAIKARRAMTK